MNYNQICLTAVCIVIFILFVLCSANADKLEGCTIETTINVSVYDQTLSINKKPEIASGGLNENIVTFDFDFHWYGFAKTAVFYCDKENVYHVALDENDRCCIPREIVQNPGCFYFGVFGTDENGITRTSDVLKYKVVQGAYTEETAVSDPTPDIYQQILSITAESKNKSAEAVTTATAAKTAAEEAKETAQNVRDDADAGSFNGKSAYELAVEKGYTGTEDEWIASLKGERGFSASRNGVILKDNPDALKVSLFPTVSDMTVVFEGGSYIINGVEGSDRSRQYTFETKDSKKMYILQAYKYYPNKPEIPRWYECYESQVDSLLYSSNGLDQIVQADCPLPIRTSKFTQIIFAIVTIPANTTKLTEDMIQDCRFNDHLCGVLYDVIDGNGVAY